MAGKALNALRKQKPDQVIDVDELAATIPPGTSTHFTTAVVQTDMEVECRDDDGNITKHASLKLIFRGPATVAQVGNQVLAIGGQMYSTDLQPAFAVAFLRQALAEAEESLASMQEKPLTSSIPIAGSMADVERAAAAAEASDKMLKGDG